MPRPAGWRSRRVSGDATALDLGRSFDLILAPVGFAQIIGGASERQALLRVIARHLAVTGVAVVAIVDVDEVLRECATPAPRRRLHVRGRTYVCQQLAATETEGGARDHLEARRPPAKRGTCDRSSHRTRRADVPAPESREPGRRAHAPVGLHMPHVHHDPGDAASLGSTYCVLRGRSINEPTKKHAEPSTVVQLAAARSRIEPLDGTT